MKDNIETEAVKDKKRKIPKIIAAHAKEIISAVAIGVLVTIISTIILDRYFMDDSEKNTPGMVSENIAPNTQPNYRPYMVRAKLTQVIGMLAPAKLYLNEYYMSTGRFPENKEDLDLSMLDLSEHPMIEKSYLTGNGGIAVDLSSEFGDSKYVSLVPKASTNGTFINWNCTTNIEQKYLGVGDSKICKYSKK